MSFKNYLSLLSLNIYFFIYWKKGELCPGINQWKGEFGIYLHFCIQTFRHQISLQTHKKSCPDKNGETLNSNSILTARQNAFPIFRVSHSASSSTRSTTSLQWFRFWSICVGKHSVGYIYKWRTYGKCVRFSFSFAWAVWMACRL